jgi:hypothetical protein
MLALLAFILVVGIGPAWAPGSLSLQDVLAAVKDVPKLEAEITGELKSSGLNAEKVVCWAARHGNHWKYLGGKRAAPYECESGQRKLTIEAEITYYDAKGRSLGDADVADPRRAKTFREKNFRWAWSP